MNGREWRARQMGRAGMKYVRQDNCFPWVEDWGRAQRLPNGQLRRNWPSGEVPKSFRGEVSSDLKWREEGVRIKHSVNGNSVKQHDKAFTAVGSVLRAETTIHHGGEFRVYRRKEGDSQGKKSWRVLRGGEADLHRSAEISERAAER